MLSKKDKYFLDLAIQIAEEGEANQRHGCVVVKNGKIQALGINRDVTHPSVLSEEHIKPGASIHAEARALKKLRHTNQANGAILYVARLTPAGRVGYSKPCPLCQKAIEDSGIKRVVHS